MAKDLPAGWALGGALDTGRFNFRQPSGLGFQVAKRRGDEQRAFRLDRARLESDWRRWVRTMFPGHVSDEDGDFVPFAEHHERFWGRLWAISPGVKPPPTLWGWPRGQVKSTSMEMGTVALGARGIRPYGLYLCNLQEQANDHVTNVKDMIANSEGIARYYPDLAGRARVVLRGEGGKKYRYEVTESFVASPEDSWVMSRVRDKDLVTLQTCTGPNLSQRLIVRAERV